MYRYIVPALLSGSLISRKGNNWNSSNFSNTDIDSKMNLYNRNIGAQIPVEKCFEFFKNTNSCQDVSQNFVENNGTNTEYINEEINDPILWSEIEKAVCSLKNTKSCGLVEILNKHIKCSYNLPSMRNILLKSFNIIFYSELVLTQWSIGNIIPIYKQKGNRGDPANYRPITLLSCMGKLFTCIINNRLQFFFSENHDNSVSGRFQKGIFYHRPSLCFTHTNQFMPE